MMHIDIIFNVSISMVMIDVVKCERDFYNAINSCYTDLITNILITLNAVNYSPKLLSQIFDRIVSTPLHIAVFLLGYSPIYLLSH